MKRIVIVGSGTAGLVSAIYLRQMFPLWDIKVVSSSAIGIVGVGEGSTEHWKEFQTTCEIPVMEMMAETKATHKYGIRFENWTTHTPDYFHSVSDRGRLTKGSFIASYAYALASGDLLTDCFSSRGLRENKLEWSDMPHLNTNQYHFDTVKLNDYLTKLCKRRNVTMIEGEVKYVKTDLATGFFTTLVLADGQEIEGDFFIDASGFKRLLAKYLPDDSFVSFSDYLPCDSAFAFPTKADPSGEIRPYTRARALDNGWMWEIPTQERRGNGYVYSSQHCTDEEALREASAVHGFEIEPVKSFRFEAGYYKKGWQKNCVLIGLASSFVEPLEATSIGSTIQQVRLLSSYLPTFTVNSKKTVNEYNRIMDSVMENLSSMVALHYISDRTDTKMWKDCQSLKRPDLLTHLLDIWSERAPEYHDVPTTGFELFGVNHFWHVAQGQGVLNYDSVVTQIDAYNSKQPTEEWQMVFQAQRQSTKLIDHAGSFKELYE